MAFAPSLLRLLLPRDPWQVTFVVRYLRVSEVVAPSERRIAERFVTHALRRDGVFILRMIASHAGDLIATEVPPSPLPPTSGRWQGCGWVQILASLWKSFKGKVSRVYKPALVGDPAFHVHHTKAGAPAAEASDSDDAFRSPLPRSSPHTWTGLGVVQAAAEPEAGPEGLPGAAEPDAQLRHDGGAPQAAPAPAPRPATAPLLQHQRLSETQPCI